MTSHGDIVAEEKGFVKEGRAFVNKERGLTTAAGQKPLLLRPWRPPVQFPARYGVTAVPGKTR